MLDRSFDYALDKPFVRDSRNGVDAHGLNGPFTFMRFIGHVDFDEAILHEISGKCVSGMMIVRIEEEVDRPLRTQIRAALCD